MKATARTLAPALLLVSMLTAGAAVLRAQESKKQATGTITGRVTFGGKPVPRVIVLLTPASTVQLNPMQSTPPLKGTTDNNGRYRITGVEAGSYRVSPHAPALVAETGSEQMQTVTVSDGEDADDIDFALKRGGVITGHVTDAEGKPVIGQRINLTQADAQGQWIQTYRANSFMFTTDDRGIYRLYGLAPGRYKVSVGDGPGGMIRMGAGGASYTRTFHPDEVEEARARVIELTSGSEATNVDIAMSRRNKTFVATGRIVDADSGTPISDLRYGYGALSPDQRSVSGYGTTGNRTGPTGEFRIDGLGPGRYATFAIWEGPAEYYSEPAVFDVAGADVSQIEIKVRRGSSISGVAVLEGSDDAEALAKLSKLDLRAFVFSQELSAPFSASARVGADGSFRLSGLKPGKARISFGSYPPIKGLVLLRTERDGVEQRDGAIEVGPGEQVAGVRVIVGHGNGIIRGQVKLEGGEKPPNAQMMVTARRASGQITPPSGSGQVDARGRFTLEGLMPGEYEVVVRLMVVAPPPPPGGDPPGIPAPPSIARQASARQAVVVANGAEVEVTIVLNLADKNKSDER